MDQEERVRSALSGRYRIEREIGAGGMATVYLAQDLRHDRQVAVKVLDPDLAETLGAERFLREIKTAARLTHPHILPLHDSGAADDFLFYVMPYVKGESLQARLTKEKQLPVEDAVQITREIADALAYAHRQGVIHRDVKPANIMLDEGHAALADFGVAHAVAGAKDERITRTGTFLGTPAYMSPEQAMGEQDLDGRSDQYALGCVLYEMLAGHPPFSGGQVEAVVRQHLTERPPPVTRTRPAVTEEVARVINRALSKSPADRFKTTGEMAAALAFSTTLLPKETRPLRKRLRIGSGIAALVAIAAVAKMFPRPEPEPPPDSPGVVQGGRLSIAVLPFENFSPNPDDAYFADGMHEELGTMLGKISGLSVRGRTSVMRYRTDPKPLPEIAHELGVTHVIGGSVRFAGGQVSLTVQLMDAVRDEHLWAEEYDREFSVADHFSIQREIAGHVVSTVRAVLTPEDEVRLATDPTTSTDAYEAYLLGHDDLRRLTDLSIKRAIEHFHQAVARDPTFAAAYASLAVAHSLQGTWYHRAGAEVYPLARRYAEQALALDSTLAEAHGVLALVHSRLEWDWEAAERSFRRSIELNDEVAQVHYHYLGLLQSLGRWDECLSEFRRARDLEPLEPQFRFGAVGCQVYQGGGEKALQELDEATSIHPEYPWAPMFFAYTYGELGRWEESAAQFSALFTALEAQGERPPLSLEAIAGHVFAKSGDRDRAEAILSELQTRLAAGDPDDYIPADMIAILHIGLGRYDDAMAFLRQAYEDREQGLVFLSWWPYRDVHADPRYQELVHRVFPERLVWWLGGGG